MLKSVSRKVSAAVVLAAVLFISACASSGPGNLGPYPEAIARWTDDEKVEQKEKAASLMAQIGQAVSDKKEFFRIPAGDYRFPAADGTNLILFKDVAGMKVDATDVTFWFDVTCTLKMENCKDFELDGLTIDYDPLPFSQGELIDFDNEKGTITVQLDPNYPFVLEDFLNESAQAGDGGVHIRYFEPESRSLVMLPWEAVSGVEEIAENTYRIKTMENRIAKYAEPTRLRNVEAGYLVSINCHGYGVIENINGENVTLRNVTVYSSPAFAFKETTGTGPNTYDNIKVIRRPDTNRLMVSTRDIFHSYLMKNGPVVKNCTLSRNGDDVIAIHGFFSLVVENHSPTELTILAPYGLDFSKGSKLSFYDLETGQPLEESLVEAIDVFPAEQSAAMADQFYKKLGENKFITRGFVPETQVARVTMAEAVDLPEYAAALSYENCGAGAKIINNHIFETTRHAIFVRSHHVEIRNNLIEKAAGSAVVHAADSFWFEAPFSHHSVIADNRIIDCGYGVVSANTDYLEPALGAIHVSSIFGKYWYPAALYPYTQNHDITVENNQIIRPAAIAICMANTRDSVIKGNLIDSPFAKTASLSSLNLAHTSRRSLPDDPRLKAQLAEPYHAIFAPASENITIENNTVINAPEFLKPDLVIEPWTK